MCDAHTHEQNRRKTNHQTTIPKKKQAARRVQYVHAAGEDTGMPNESIDMVSVCLVNHELPNAAARQVFREAHRCVLRCFFFVFEGFGWV